MACFGLIEKAMVETVVLLYNCDELKVVTSPSLGISAAILDWKEDVGAACCSSLSVPLSVELGTCS